MTSCTKHPFSSFLALLALIAASGCSTVLEGRSQKITVDSSPEGAQCVFKQADDVVAQVTTPGTVTVDKSKNDLVVLCSKAGYESISKNNHSGFSIASLGNMVFGQYSFIGNAVDSASGANNKYDSEVFVALAEAPTPTAFPPPPGPPPVIAVSSEAALSMSMQATMPGKQLMPSPLAVAAVVAEMPVTRLTSSSQPAIRASMMLAKAALTVEKREKVMQLSYAEAMAQAPLRPPFEISQ